MESKWTLLKKFLRGQVSKKNLFKIFRINFSLILFIFFHPILICIGFSKLMFIFTSSMLTLLVILISSATLPQVKTSLLQESIHLASTFLRGCVVNPQGDLMLTLRHCFVKKCLLASERLKEMDVIELADGIVLVKNNSSIGNGSK